MPKCSFCGSNYDVPRGMTFVLPNGDVLYFCSSKCQKNKKLGRRGDKKKWVTKRKTSKKEELEAAKQLAHERAEKAEEKKEADEKAEVKE
jgi:large subunit ribosomal protein L24e